MEIDVSVAKTHHYDMWNWLANNPDKQKMDWPGWEANNIPAESVFNCCFACQIDLNMGTGNCAHCPCNWGEAKYCYTTDENEGLYDLWCDAYEFWDEKERVRLALLIRDSWR